MSNDIEPRKEKHDDHVWAWVFCEFTKDNAWYWFPQKEPKKVVVDIKGKIA